ncbi:MAG: hypothetical protein NW226_26155 [Microscillaceae bacterium]|nr:hypothetical protein [Microscillaceae bacterium]
MHPKIKRFIELTQEKELMVDEYCHLFKQNALLEDEIALLRLEFSDEANNQAKLLLLEIELEELYRTLREQELKLITLSFEIESLNLLIHHL